MKDLEQFDQLSSDITLFVAPSLKVRVTDVESSASAIDVAKQLKTLLTAVDKKKRELTAPLKDKVNAINDYAKKITAPLEEADTHIRSELNRFATEQEKIRRAEQERIERERIAAERKAREERERIEEEMRIRQEAEAENHAQVASLFGADPADIEQSNKEVDDKQTREWAEKQAELNRQDAVAQIEIEQKRYDAKQLNVSNARETWYCKATDITLVPREFLTITLNEKAVLVAAKAGVKIPGVETWSEMKVAIGANTRAPRLA